MCSKVTGGSSFRRLLPKNNGNSQRWWAVPYEGVGGASRIAGESDWCSVKVIVGGDCQELNTWVTLEVMVAILDHSHGRFGWL